jgi:hypothetical protein
VSSEKKKTCTCVNAIGKNPVKEEIKDTGKRVIHGKNGSVSICPFTIIKALSKHC